MAIILQDHAIDRLFQGTHALAREVTQSELHDLRRPSSLKSLKHGVVNKKRVVVVVGSCRDGKKISVIVE